MTQEQRFTSEDGKVIFYWPYCETCHLPYDFDEELPLAYCKCGVSEWGYPRPAEWIPNPSAVAFELETAKFWQRQYREDIDARHTDEYPCTNCGGKGYVEVDDGYQMHHHVCSWCKGTKKLPNRRRVSG